MHETIIQLLQDLQALARPRNILVKRLLFSAVFCISGAIISTLLSPAPAYAVDNAGLKGGVFSPTRSAPDFALHSSNGGEVSLHQFRNKLVILEFGYTSCADVCPTSLAMLASVRQKLGAQAKDVQLIYITVDPERDTVKIMKPYLAGFDPSFIGATGSAAQLAQVRKDYGIQASKSMLPGSKTAYTMSHSSYLYFIDPQGQLRSMMPFGSRVDDVVSDIRVLLGSANSAR